MFGTTGANRSATGFRSSPWRCPLGIDNPMRLLRAVSTRTEIMKNARAAHLVALLASSLGAAPPPLQALVLADDPYDHAADAAF